MGHCVHRQVIGAFVVACFALGACDKKESVASDNATVSAPQSAVVASASANAQHEERRHRCPTEVEGAVVTVTDVDGGVALNITTTNEANVADIRSRATRISEMSQRFGDSPRGEGRRDGGGEHHGHCAAMVPGAKSTAKDIAGGTTITLVPADPADLARVRTDVRDRLAHP